MELRKQKELFEEVIESGPYPIRFPAKEGLDQDEEWCEVCVDDAWKRIRFHDYHEVYKIPGLYETIFYRTLRCNSPVRVVSLLEETLQDRNVQFEDLAVLDIGAGNGMVGEPLQTMGTRTIFGIDILPEAKDAAERDRPWVYNDYRVMDLTDTSSEEEQWLREKNANTLVSVAALGYGDIPPRAFSTAYNVIAPGGWIALNIKESFLRGCDQTGFSALIQRMNEKGLLLTEAFRRYRHRLSVTGEPLFYVAMVARKVEDIPSEFLS